MAMAADVSVSIPLKKFAEKDVVFANDSPTTAGTIQIRVDKEATPLQVAQALEKLALFYRVRVGFKGTPPVLPP